MLRIYHYVMNQEWKKSKELIQHILMELPHFEY